MLIFNAEAPINASFEVFRHVMKHNIDSCVNIATNILLYCSINQRIRLKRSLLFPELNEENMFISLGREDPSRRIGN